MEDPLDPVKAIEERLRLLEAEIGELQRRKVSLLAKRGVWPKIVKVNVGKGQWTDDVVSMLADCCGWLKTEDGQIGPLTKVVAADAHLYYMLREDGTVKLVGALDAEFGKVGKTKET